MRPKKHPTESVARRGGLSVGLLYGLAFFLPGVILLNNWNSVEQFLTGVYDAPVIKEISKDFETGFEVAGKLFNNYSHQFYTSKTIIVGSDGKVREDYLNGRFPQKIHQTAIKAWDRRGVEQKLENDFGKRKMKRAKKLLDYVDQYKHLAVFEMTVSHIPASITLAQGILESKSGGSYLATKANNHFGIKCRKFKDYKKDGVIDDQDFYNHYLAYSCIQRSDDHDYDHFEMYDTPEHSFRHHTLLLFQSSRYNWMIGKYKVGQNYDVPSKWFKQDKVPYYAAWSIGLKDSGYATSKTYAQKLAYLIETYDLWKFDYEVVLGNHQ